MKIFKIFYFGDKGSKIGFLSISAFNQLTEFKKNLGSLSSSNFLWPTVKEG